LALQGILLLARTLILMDSQSTQVRHNTQQSREARGEPEARKEAAHCATCAHLPRLFTCAQLTSRSSRAHSHPFPSLHPSFHLPTPFARVDSVYITTAPVPCPSRRTSRQSLYVGLNPPTLLVHPSATSCPPLFLPDFVRSLIHLFPINFCRGDFSTERGALLLVLVAVDWRCKKSPIEIYWGFERAVYRHDDICSSNPSGSRGPRPRLDRPPSPLPAGHHCCFHPAPE